MKRIWIVLLVAAFCYGIDDPTKKSTEKPAAAKSQTKGAVKTKAAAAKKTAASVIPPGAKEIEPGVFRWVDAKGQAWNYHSTPFGYMKAPEEKAVAEPVPTDWSVSEQGDNVTFTKPSPFGIAKWTVKKSAMNETESAVYKRNSELREKN